MNERRDGQRRRGDLKKNEPRNGGQRRRRERRARARAGVVLVMASLTSASAVRGYLDGRRPGLSSLPPTIPAVTREAATTVRPSSNSKFNAHIQDAAARHGVSTALIRAVIQVESGFDPRAVSRTGARGLMQLMPATARRFGVVNRFNARQNIFGGTRFLRALLDRYEGDVSLTAAAYNAGEGCVARHYGIPPYKETQDYVRKVTTLLSIVERDDDGEGKG